jgi:hypothetical protein
MISYRSHGKKKVGSLLRRSWLDPSVSRLGDPQFFANYIARGVLLRELPIRLQYELNCLPQAFTRFLDSRRLSVCARQFFNEGNIPFRNFSEHSR